MYAAAYVPSQSAWNPDAAAGNQRGRPEMGGNLIKLTFVGNLPCERQCVVLVQFMNLLLAEDKAAKNVSA